MAGQPVQSLDPGPLHALQLPSQASHVCALASRYVPAGQAATHSLPCMYGEYVRHEVQLEALGPLQPRQPEEQGWHASLSSGYSVPPQLDAQLLPVRYGKLPPHVRQSVGAPPSQVSQPAAQGRHWEVESA